MTAQGDETIAGTRRSCKQSPEQQPNMRPLQLGGTKWKHAPSRACLRRLIPMSATLVIAMSIFGMAMAAGADECLTREGKQPILSKEDAFSYQRQLFLTPDEVARYVFLTNRRNDGDRSAAVYRARPKKESLSGDYRVTATVAADSLTDHPNALVRRFDAPLPASVADVLHELWLAVCQQSRVDEEAIPSAPTGIFSVVIVRGPRLTVVTTSLADEHSVCLSLLNLGESLINYAKMPESQRAEAARKIERESLRLLKRVKQKR